MNYTRFLAAFAAMALAGFTVGLGVGSTSSMNKVATAIQQRDEAIGLAISFEESFKSLQKSFDSMERTANLCIESQRR